MLKVWKLQAWVSKICYKTYYARVIIRNKSSNFAADFGKAPTD